MSAGAMLLRGHEVNGPPVVLQVFAVSARTMLPKAPHRFASVRGLCASRVTEAVVVKPRSVVVLQGARRPVRA
eukprot:9977815-Alexandrium_andersonii.AAC.1